MINIITNSHYQNLTWHVLDTEHNWQNNYYYYYPFLIDQELRLKVQNLCLSDKARIHNQAGNLQQLRTYQSLPGTVLVT